MAHKKFSDSQIGDDVFTIMNGWEKCTRIYSGNPPYPIEVGLASYTNTGRVLDAHANASAWTYDPFDGTEPPIREFIKGHWYPVITIEGRMSATMRYNGEVFVTWVTVHHMPHVTYVEWSPSELAIGESLGVIEFPTSQNEV